MIIKNSASENLLDIIIDNKLDFTMHLDFIWKGKPEVTCSK